MKLGKGLGSVLAALLLGGVLLQLPIWRTESARLSQLKGKPLAKRLPPGLAGGTAQDEPIAGTEEMKKAVGELLNFSDGVYRIYRIPGARISAYVAWWEAGRMSPRLVAGHTPDVCWPENGWVRNKDAEGSHMALSEELSAKGFAEGETRVFVTNSKPEYVVFWHKVGDEMLSYQNGWAPPWWAWIDEMWRGGLNLKKEQLFVRVSSDRPLEEIWSRSETEPLRKALLQLGLQQTKPET